MRAVMFLVLLAASSVSAVLHVGQKSEEHACETADLKRRAQFQNKLAGLCEEMCKEIGQYPNCAQCAGFVPPDSTPGVKTWRKQASVLQKSATPSVPALLHVGQKSEEKA